MANQQLGNAAQITIGTSDLEASLPFYAKLGFEVVKRDTKPNPWAQVSDGSVLILLNQDNMSYMGLTYFSADMPQKVEALKAKGVNFVQEIKNGDTLFQAILETPDKFYVSLINHDATDMYQPTEPTLADIPESDWEKAPSPNAKIGIFGELCHDVTDVDKSIAFWEILGFKVKKYPGPYPWAIAMDGHHIVGLHQTKDFDYPALTYFAKDMGERLKALKADGVDSLSVFTGQGGNESNMVATTPEGQKFFLFSY